jgi:diacylglycerol kinase family enzyme
VPAGTRNHFALDLGLDRDDVPGALKAYEDGVDTQVDLAEVNGRVFVNNASMGVYAEIVQSADYRDAKLHTVAAMLPDLLGPTATPIDLHFTLPSGQKADSAQLLLVSNNPYQLARLRGGGTRERLDGGALGIAYVRVDTATDAEGLAALELAGQVQRFARWNEWTASEFVVRSGGPVEIGIDGEALILDPPLRFVIRPRALTVRLPRTAPRRSPAARFVRVIAKPTVVALWHTLLGHPTG